MPERTASANPAQERAQEVFGGQAREGKPFDTVLRIPGSAKLRAVVAGEASFTWRQKVPGAAKKAKRGKRRHRLAPRSQTAQAAAADPALAPYYEAFGG